MPHCDTVLTQLRQRGYRITPQRELIIGAIMHSAGHMTAEAVHARVQQHTSAINLATVYRTLDLLVDEGLATRDNLRSAQSTYAPQIHGAHLHLICRYCHTSLDTDEPLMACVGQQIHALYGFQADLHHLTISGVCRRCQEQPPSMTQED